MDKTKIKHILIIKPSSLGDVLHAFPAVSLIADRYPDASIDWLINKSFAPLLEFHPNVDDVIIFPRKELGNPRHFFKSFFRLVKRLREKKYDLIVDLQGLMRSAVFAKIAKSSRVVGFASPREKISACFYMDKIDIPGEAVHAVERNLYLVTKMLEIDYHERAPEMKILEPHRRSMLEKLQNKGIDENTPCIGISPVARWQSKSWPPSFFAEVINKLHIKFPDCKFILTGVPEDGSAADEILKLVNGNSTISMIGETSVSEFVELLRHCKLLISNDSGPMHIACALQTPVFGVFGPTDPDKTGPFGTIHHIFKADVDCEKCFKRECPNGTYRCHGAIDVNAFSNAVIAEIENNI